MAKVAKMKVVSKPQNISFIHLYGTALACPSPIALVNFFGRQDLIANSYASKPWRNSAPQIL